MHPRTRSGGRFSPPCAGLACVTALLLTTAGAAANAESDGADYLAFVKSQAAALRAGQRLPTEASDGESRARRLRADLERAWGGFPPMHCPLEPRVLGVAQRDGYRVERVTFQTVPGVWMLANAYVPNQAGRHPAVLCVHGHWPRAKQDPVVQARCIGLVKLGFFVLAVDAFGAGERAIGKALGEYHGAMTGALLLPIGRPLSGLQVYENGRAVDYLRARPEVDPERIGITGASGGGNQSMYAGAYDERFAAVVPVCSVGTYDAYLGAACCMCEVVPGALRFTEEGQLLALTAPRHLMVINATRDAPQFSVGEARKSLEWAGRIFAQRGCPDHVRHTIIESAHDYNQPMREAMYGWMTRGLKGQGDGQPIAEPPVETVDPESLRCYPGETRPDDYVTLPRFAAAEARRLLALRRVRSTSPNHEAQIQALAAVLGQAFTVPAPLDARRVAESAAERIEFTSESGLRLAARRRPTPRNDRLALVLDWRGAEAAEAQEATQALRAAGWATVTLDLRATGRLAVPRDAIGDCPDHNSAEWGLWIGRPLLGQWVHDVRRTLDAITSIDGRPPQQTLMVGIGPLGIVGLAAAALDDRVARAACVGTLASFVSETPYQRQVLGIMAPGIVRDVGDVTDLAALLGERPVHFVNPVRGDGKPLSESDARTLLERPGQARVASWEEFVESLRGS